ncbi:MAG: MobC family plasmid mobilization relaxosome protein [Lachnospiraceae bacterium]
MQEKTYQIHIRLSKEEYDELLRQKEFLGCMTYAQVIRNYIRNGVCYRFDYDGLFETATQISRIGNNINQIAKAVNETHDITQSQIIFLKKHMAQIEQILGDAIAEKEHVSRYLAENFFVGGAHNGNHKDH